LRARGDSCDSKGATCVLVDLGKGVAKLGYKRGNLGLRWYGGQTIGSVTVIVGELALGFGERFSPDILRRLLCAGSEQAAALHSVY
jgi:hypothetical protein